MWQVSETGDDSIIASSKRFQNDAQVDNFVKIVGKQNNCVDLDLH